MGDIAELLERVRQADGPNRELDLALARALAPDVICSRFNRDTRENEPFVHWNYTASIDAALALVERVLPDDSGYELIAFDDESAGVQALIGDDIAIARTAPLAILAALLQAKLAQESEQ